MRARRAAAPARRPAAGRARSAGRARAPRPRAPAPRPAAAPTSVEAGCRPTARGRCPRAAGAGWRSPGWPSGGPGSCSRAREPPMPCENTTSGTGASALRRVGQVQAHRHAALARGVDPVEVERAVGRCAWPRPARRAAARARRRRRPACGPAPAPSASKVVGQAHGAGPLQCRSALPAPLARGACGQQPRSVCTTSST